ncbi:MAG TPA: hypothetical protein VHA05_02240 [Candidatus Saccharimonadales bacterium]|nr:hypothetical protein [Candidatus Saccharimonadales bacterium]
MATRVLDNKHTKRFLKSVWAFPTALLLILLLLTAFKISGSSVGMYHQFLYGAKSKDSNLIYGHPKSVRADEWQGATPQVVGQSKIGFPTYDLTLPGGQDLSMSAAIPTKSWPTIFKPHLWIYFILPIEFAFAFQWWLMMFLLIVSCYFFVLRIMPRERLFAALIGLAFGLSPFFLWWYQAAAYMTAAYGFMIMILFMRIINRESVRGIKNQRLSDTLHVLLLAFLVASFGLILYPPFQIPVALVAAAFSLGYLLQKKYAENTRWKVLARRLGAIICGVILAGFIGLLFVHTHHATISSLNHTEYPGHRIVTSGGFSLINAVDGFVMPLLQSDQRAAHFIGNQSEASNFILLLPFILVPAAVLIWRQYRRGKINWIYLVLNLLALIFLADMFIPHGNILYKSLLLNKVPHSRLLIGTGFLGIIQLVMTIKIIKEEKVPRDMLWKFGGIYSAICLLTLLVAGIHIRNTYPMFMHSYLLIIVLAAAFTSIIGSVLVNKRILAAALLLAFSILSSFQIIPLYRGLGLLTNNRVTDVMQGVSTKNGVWAVVGDDAYNFNEYGILAARPTVSGLQTYPVLNFWRQTGDPNYNYVTNRESHVVFTDNPNLASPLTLVHNNSFNVKFECSSFIVDNISYALSVHPLSEPCVHQVGSPISYPEATFYMYKVD